MTLELFRKRKKSKQKEWQRIKIKEQRHKCSICGGPISISPKNERDYNEDHVVPRNLIGQSADEPWNVSLVHPLCNAHKGARLPSLHQLIRHMASLNREHLFEFKRVFKRAVDKHARICKKGNPISPLNHTEEHTDVG